MAPKETLAIGPPGVEVETEFDGAEGSVRVRGNTTFQQATLIGSKVMTLARERGVRRLLMNLLELGIERNPSLGERYFMVRDWAAAGAGAVRVAMIVQSHLIDPRKFGILAARNAGLACDVFSDETQAREWLGTGHSI